MPESPDRSAACPTVEDLLQHAYGELDEVPAARIEDHLDRCDACRAHVADVAAVRDAYAALPSPALPPARFERLLAVATSTGRGGRPGRAVLAPAARWLAAAAGILGFLGGYALASAERDVPRSSLVELAELREALLETATPNPPATARMRAVSVATGGGLAGAETRLLDVIAFDPSPNVRLAAIDALSASPAARIDWTRIGAALASEPLPALRSALVDLIGTHGGDDAAEWLRRSAADDEDASVRQRARAYLERSS